MLILQGQYYGKGHAIFDKDVFRTMRDDKTVEKSNLIPKPAGMRTLLEYNNNKYKTRS